MSYNREVSLTTRMIADSLGVTQKRVREIAKDLRLKPSWIGPTMMFTATQFQRMKDRNTTPGRKPAKKRKGKLNGKS